MFKRTVTKKGQELWYKDGKLTAKKHVPIEEIEKYIVKDTLENAGVFTTSTTTVPAGCVMCGAPIEYQRAVNVNGEQKTIQLCGDCYYTKTLGEIVGKIKK